jgi:acetyl esterase/lipase
VRNVVLSIVVTLTTALLMAACSGQHVLNSITTTSTYTLASNVPYEDVGDQLLDVYTPKDTRNAPVVVFFYGGRWENGTKEDFKFVGEALAARGFVAVLPNYRLYPQAKYHDFLADSARAVVWAHKNINRYGGNPDKLVVMGHSSGAYNAAMVTLNADYLKQAGGDRSWIRGMVGLAGPYDFLPLTDPDLRDIFGPPESFEQSQPVFWVDGHNPPMLLMHGEDDETVLVKNTRNLAARIQRAGGPVETVIYPEMSHTKIIASVTTSSIARLAVGKSDVMTYVADFVTRASNARQKTPQDDYGIQTSVPK